MLTTLSIPIYVLIYNHVLLFSYYIVIKLVNILIFLFTMFIVRISVGYILKFVNGKTIIPFLLKQNV